MSIPVFNRTITDAAGNVVPNAQITVVDERTDTLATLFDNRDGDVAKSNPFTADTNGFAQFFAAPGVYRVTAEFGALSRTWRFESLLDNAVDIEWNGKQTFTDEVTFTKGVGEPGMIAAFAMSSAPTGWLVANGAGVSTTTYPELFAAIGYTWGGSGATFNLPDMREVAPVGIGARGAGASADTYTLGQFKDDQMQGHFHDVLAGGTGIPYAIPGQVNFDGTTARDTWLRSSSKTSGGVTALTAKNAESDTTPGNSAPRTGTTTRGKRVGVQYCIKF